MPEKKEITYIEAFKMYLDADMDLVMPPLQFFNQYLSKEYNIVDSEKEENKDYGSSLDAKFGL